MKFDIVGPGYVGRSTNLNANRSVNFYPEVDSQDAKTVVALIGTPGTSLFTDTGLGAIRGLHAFNDVLYVVAGGKLYSISGDGTLSSQLGSDLVTSAGRIVMVDNGLSPTGGNELAITDGQKIYIWDVNTSTFTTNSITAYTVCFIGGYFVADIGGGRWQVSDLYDGTTWNALNISTADAAPDTLLSVFNNHGELWLFGEYTTEIWYQSGTGNPPFARQTGGVIDYGCAARYSIAKGNNTVFWLGTKRNNDRGEFIGVCMANGYNAQIISPPAINYTISTYTTISDAFAYCYTDGGHEFYVLTFPTANATWVYDTTTGFWHERSTYDDDPYVVRRHLGNCYAYFNSNHYVGDFESGKIYEMNSATYSDHGDPIVSFRTCPHIHDGENLNRMFISKIQIDGETGVGETADPLHQASLAESYTISYNFLHGVLYDQDYVWFSASGAPASVYKVDPSDGSLVSTISVNANNGTLQSLVFDADGYLWVTGNTYDEVYKVDIDLETVVDTVTVARDPYGIEYYNGHIWVACEGDNEVDVIDVSTGTVVNTIAVGAVPKNILYARGNIWVANYNGDTISKIGGVSNPATASVSSTISVGKRPFGLVYNGTYIWVANRNSNSVMSIDPVTDTIINTVYVGTQPFGAAYDGTYMWVTNYGSDSTSKIDLSTATVVTTVKVGDQPSWAAYGNNSLWVVNYNDKTVSQLNTFVENPITNPKASLAWSDDGGHTWSDDKVVDVGKQGVYRTRMIWRRLGRARDRVFRVTMADPVKKVLLSSYIEASGGMN